MKTINQKTIILENNSTKSEIFKTEFDKLLKQKSEAKITSVEFIRRKLALNNKVNNFISIADLLEFEKLFIENPEAFIISKSNDVSDEYCELNETNFLWHDELDNEILIEIITSENYVWKKEIINTAIGELIDRCK